MIDRLNRFPQGAPESETLYSILKMLFTEKEADLVAQMPIRPFTAEDAAGRWNMKESEAHNILDSLAGRPCLSIWKFMESRCTAFLPPWLVFLNFP